MPTPGEEQIVSTVADALPLGVWVARAPGGEFIYANTTFMEIMGMAARDDIAVGEYAEPYRIHDRDGNVYPEATLPFVRAIQQRETVMVDDLVIHRNDGGRVAVRAYARPIFEGDEITHVVIAFFDITREVEAERARADSEARAQRAQRLDSIGNLAGGIAHDFNNLLAAIRTIASALAMTEQDPGRLEDLKTIDAATESAAKLTRALLGFAGRGKNLSQPTQVDDVVRAVTTLFGRALDKRYSMKTELSALLFVKGDAGQLEQVVMNLLLNARDAMSEGGTITMRSRDEGNTVVVEVEDEGAGVPVEIRDRVFEPYFTTKEHRTDGSAGLGLATAYGIVEAHGGRLSIVDGRGGALFRAVFPAMEGPAEEVRQPPRPPVVPGAGLILVVDDEGPVRLATCRALEMAGYQVVSAEDGLQGVELFEQKSAEIAGVVLDLSMPTLGGRATYLRMRDVDPDVRVLLMTGYALNEEAQAVLDLGVQGFIEKPFDVSKLSAELARVLAG